MNNENENNGGQYDPDNGHSQTDNPGQDAGNWLTEDIDVEGIETEAGYTHDAGEPTTANPVGEPESGNEIVAGVEEGESPVNTNAPDNIPAPEPVYSPTPASSANPKKRFSGASLAVAVVVALAAGALGASLLFTAIRPSGGSTEYVTRADMDTKIPVVLTESFAAADIQNMEIMLLSTSVFFEAGTGDDVNVEWFSSESSDVQRPAVRLEDGKLTITEYEYSSEEFNAVTRLFRKERTDSYVTVYLPDGFSVQSIAASIVSGEFSGAENVALDAEYISVTTISGSMFAQKVRANSLTADSISGGIFIAMDSDNLEYAEINTISGECRLTLPQGTKMNVTTSSISGRVNVSQDLLDTEAERQVSFSSVSGDLYIS